MLSGMTLVELMVSIGILTAVILIVSSLLANAQRAVGSSQGTIVADADARAAVNRLRTDLARLTTEGFLAIYTDINDRRHLVFTAVGPYRSMTETDAPTIANAARIDYGLTGDADKILWRRAFLLNGEGITVTAGDREKISLADYKVWDRAGIDAALYNAGGTYNWPIGNPFDCFITSPSITLPPNSLSEVRGLWPYLARPCSNLKIYWTDGTTDANGMIWYGDNGGLGDVNPKESDWADKVPADDTIEYNAGDAANPRYCTLWTHRKKDNWPLALRITFTLGTGETARTYEVIVDLPR